MSSHHSIPVFSEMFRPPVNHAMRVLDRTFFNKRVPLTAARVLDNKQISQCRAELGDAMLHLERLANVRPDPEAGSAKSGKKSLLLRPDIRFDDSSTWTGKLQELVKAERVAVAPYDLELNYEYWTYHEIITAILPERDQDEIPTGFSIVGHVAHLNLREQYLPYKTLVANVLLDKNPTIRTVINKIDDVGTQNEYRTFQYELLAGHPSMDVDVREQDCIFRFNYSKVYWNTRLSTEHKRLVEIFRPGEAVCDVMAGVGPFAVPAGKKRVFVWANDLNPDSYRSLVAAVTLNKVNRYVQPFNEEGRDFIRKSAQQLLKQNVTVEVPSKKSRLSRSLDLSHKTEQPQPDVLTQPKVFSHYVMNLPATAITFLDAFIGIYRGQDELFSPHTDTRLPMIHVHCFSTKSDDNLAEETKICAEISQRLGFTISRDDREVQIWDVRDVAPQKRMFCASFRLPAEVAFR